MARRSRNKRPLEYRVAAVILKPNKGEQHLTLTKKSLDDALELARDMYIRATIDGYELAVRVETPAGHCFADWAVIQEESV